MMGKGRRVCVERANSVASVIGLLPGFHHDAATRWYLGWKIRYQVSLRRCYSHRCHRDHVPAVISQSWIYLLYSRPCFNRIRPGFQFASPSALTVHNSVVIHQGVCSPSMHSLLSKWAPPDERSSMAAFIYAGNSNQTWLIQLLNQRRWRFSNGHHRGSDSQRPHRRFTGLGGRLLHRRPRGAHLLADVDDSGLRFAGAASAHLRQGEGLHRPSNGQNGQQPESE